MLLSRKFVNDYTNLEKIDINEYANSMLKLGNEYDSITPLVKANKLVIGEVLECDLHPESDHLHVCRVDIKSEVLKQNDLLCKISDIEYLLLFRNPKDVDQIIRDCNNQTSVLLHYELDYNETKIETNNTLGIVYSNESIKTAKDFMHSLDSALAYANTEGYEKPYSIYNYSSKTLRERLTVNNLAKDYSFDKIKISLDNSFLDDEDDL